MATLHIVAAYEQLGLEGQRRPCFMCVVTNIRFESYL